MKPIVEVKIAIQDLTGQFVVLEVFAWRLLIAYIPPMLSNAFLNNESIKDLNFKLGIKALNAQCTNVDFKPFMQTLIILSKLR